MNLDQLIEVLSPLSQDLKVIISAPIMMAPDGFDSYRGYYEDLCIEPKVIKNHEEIPVLKDFLQSLKNCIGSTYGGWKGGEFTMFGDARLWIAESGIASSCQVSGVSVQFDCYARIEWVKSGDYNF